jgi:predicted amidohydrolase
MSQTFMVACLQTTSDRDIAPSVEATAVLARQARDQGADFITTPEMVGMMEPRRRLVLEKATQEDGHAALTAFQDLARELGAWFLVGSLAVKVEPERVANRSFLLDADGAIVARYDKLHMFDVNLKEESFRESRTYRPGDRAVLAKIPWGVLGMTVCYDVRFPHLYRDLAKAGADVLTVPSAFTRPTGRAHWHVLLRARAIETGCFVVAPAQCGVHAGERKTYGHSLIVDPWGEILADGGEEIGFVSADIDLAKVAEARAMLPSLQHDQAYAAAEPVRTKTVETVAGE